jgi:hypothetical protein
MIKLLSSLLSLLDRLWAAWNENKLRQQGRQEAIKEANDEINRQVELGEAAIAVPDPERDERLRDRFDRSRTPK